MTHALHIPNPIAPALLERANVVDLQLLPLTAQGAPPSLSSELSYNLRLGKFPRRPIVTSTAVLYTNARIVRTLPALFPLPFTGQLKMSSRIVFSPPLSVSTSPGANFRAGMVSLEPLTAYRGAMSARIFFARLTAMRQLISFPIVSPDFLKVLQSVKNKIRLGMFRVFPRHNDLRIVSEEGKRAASESELAVRLAWPSRASESYHKTPLEGGR